MYNKPAKAYRKFGCFWNRMNNTESFNKGTCYIQEQFVIGTKYIEVMSCIFCAERLTLYVLNHGCYTLG